MPMKATCIFMRYYPGEYALRQGIRGGGVSGRSYYKSGKKHVQGGFGYEQIFTASQYILYVEIDEKVFGILVDHYFKTYVGKLTAKRRRRIEMAMPKSIHVKECKGRDGRYFIADEGDLQKWQKAAGL